MGGDVHHNEPEQPKQPESNGTRRERGEEVETDRVEAGVIGETDLAGAGWDLDGFKGAIGNENGNWAAINRSMPARRVGIGVNEPGWLREGI